MDLDDASKISGIASAVMAPISIYVAWLAIPTDRLPTSVWGRTAGKGWRGVSRPRVVLATLLLLATAVTASLYLTLAQSQPHSARIGALSRRPEPVNHAPSPAALVPPSPSISPAATPGARLVPSATTPHPLTSGRPSVAPPVSVQDVESETIRVSLTPTSYLYLNSRPIVSAPDNPHLNMSADLQTGPGGLESRSSTDFSPVTDDPTCRHGPWSRKRIPLGRGSIGDYCLALTADVPVAYLKLHLSVDQSYVCTMTFEFLRP